MNSNLKNRVIMHDVAIKKILQYIKDNNLKKGDKLPTERGWTEILGISRVSIREAMKVLQSNYIISIKQGSGIYFENYDSSLFSLYLDENDELSKATLLAAKEMVEARKMIEQYGIMEAAKVITKEQIQLLYEHETQEYTNLISKSGNSEAPGLNLENLIISFLGNTYITNTHTKLNEMWKGRLSNINAVALSPLKRHTDHHDIIKAIEDKDYIKLKKSIKKHHEKTKNAIEDLLKQY